MIQFIILLPFYNCYQQVKMHPSFENHKSFGIKIRNCQLTLWYLIYNAIYYYSASISIILDKI